MDRIGNSFALLIGLCGLLHVAEVGAQPTVPAEDTQGVGQTSSVQIPPHFEANHGQFASEVKFVARTQAYSVWFTSKELILSAGSGDQRAAVKMHFGGGGGELVAEERLRGTVNYLKGFNSQRWVRNAPTYARVVQRQAYPGIDVVYRFEGTELEYDLIIARGADPGCIRLHFEGTKRTLADAAGNLILSTLAGEFRQRRPHIYQETITGRRAVTGRFILDINNDAHLEIAEYDRTRALVIDPALTYSTYVNNGAGTGYGFVNSVAAGTDSLSGKKLVYVAGQIEGDLPVTTGALQPLDQPSTDGFIAKIDPSSSGSASWIYATYLGGSGFDSAEDIAVDSSGNTYVSGRTQSTDFPLVRGLVDSYASTDWPFLTKISPDGGAILYSTRFGEPLPWTSGMGGFTNKTETHALSADNEGNAYIAGFTWAENLPTTTNAFQAFHRCQQPVCDRATGSNKPNAFVARFNTNGSGNSSLTYSTYLSGSAFPHVDLYDGDWANGIAVDASGQIYVVGRTGSTDFPFVNGFAARVGGFLAKLDPSHLGGAQLLYSTYIAGEPKAVAVDTSGNAYVTGKTGESDFPTTPGAFQTNYAGQGLSAFVVKIDSSKSGMASLVYSTLLSGSTSQRGEEDSGIAIALDAGGNAYVAGLTVSADFPFLNSIQDSPYGVIQSTNGGQNWTLLSNGLPQGWISSLVVDTSTSPHNLYLARECFRDFQQAPAVAVYKSRNGGLNWLPSSSGLEGLWVCSLAIDTGTQSTLYAGTTHGVYRSIDGGVTWTSFNAGASSIANENVNVLVLDGSKIYAGTTNGLYVFGGTVWMLTGHTENVHAIALDSSTNPHTLYVTSGQWRFMSKSADSGNTWTLLDVPSVFGSIVLDPTTNPARLYAHDLQQCDTLHSETWRSSDGGTTWVQGTGSGGMDCSGDLRLAVDSATTPATLYGFAGQATLWRSVDGGDNWTPAVNGYNVGALAFDLTTASAQTPSTIYLSASRPGASAFVAKLNATGSALLYSTRFGGIIPAVFSSMATDSAGTVYAGGVTYSPFLTTVNAFQSRTAGVPIGFVAVIGDPQIPMSPAGCSADCKVNTTVGVASGSLTVTFPNVTGSISGNDATLTVTPLSNTTMANLSLSNNLGAFEISTTAQYSASPSNPVALCFQVLTVNDLTTFNSVTVLHIVNSVPVDVTSSRTFATRTVCGSVTSFSPFVVVKGAVGQIQDIVRYVNDSDIKKGIQLSLDAKLDNAAKAFSSAIGHDYNSVCNLMSAFMSSVQAQVGKALTTGEATNLISAAKQVKATVGCSP